MLASRAHLLAFVLVSDVCHHQIRLERDHTQLVSEGLSSALAEELLKKFGRNELEEKSDPKWLVVSSDGDTPPIVLSSWSWSI